MDFLRQLYNGIREAWQKLSISARVNVAALAFASVVLILFVAYTGSRTTYRVVGSEIAPADIASAEAALDTAGISHRLSSDGRELMVPEGSLVRARAALASNDIHFGRPENPGYEIFDDVGLMTDRLLMNINQRRARNGQIEKMLNNYEFVDYSIVTIEQADEKFFAGEQKPSKAAVILNLNMPYNQIPKRTIQGIVQSVANSGDINLHKNNVVITDQFGNLLHKATEDGAVSLANDMLELQRNYEMFAEAKISDALSRAGVQHSVTVSARMRHKDEQVQKKEILTGQPISELINTTTITNTESLPEGAPGAVVNQPEGVPTPGGTEMKEETSEELLNNENGFVDTLTNDPAGSVESYSVNITVAKKLAPSDDPNAEPTYIDLTDADRTNYENIAKAAVGNSAVPATITITDLEFQQTEQQLALAQMGSISNLSNWRSSGTLVMQILALLAVFLLMRSFFRKAIEVPVIEEEIEEIIETPEATREDMRRQDVAREVVDMALDNPDSVAQILRSWMSEQEE